MKLTAHILCALIMTACIASAAFYHDEILQGESYTNTMMLDLSRGRAERVAAASKSSGSLGSASYSVMVGSTQSVSIITNGIYVITNRVDYPVYSTTGLVGEACLFPFVYGGATGMPHLVRSMFREFNGGLDYYGYEIAGEDSKLWHTQFFARDWEADGGDGLFNTWLGTPQTTDTNIPAYPQGPPLIVNPSEILKEKTIGWYTNVVLDAFGGITNSTWYFTKRIDVTQSWNLAECRFTRNLWATNFLFGYGDGLYKWNNNMQTHTNWFGPATYTELYPVKTNGFFLYVMADTEPGIDEEIYIGQVGRTNWLSLPFFADQGFTNNTSSAVYWHDSLSLQFVEHVPMDYNHKDGLLPDVIFTGGGSTDAFVSVTLTITGSVFAAFTATNNPDFQQQPNQDIEQAIEVVTISSTNPTPLTKGWQRVEYITASTTARDGDTYSVVYGETFPMYGSQDWTLSARDINERREFIDAMRWTYDDASFNTLWSFTTNRNNVWTGTSTNTWADAKSQAEISTPTGSFEVNKAECYTTGSKDGNTYIATAVSTRAVRYFGAAINGFSTNYEHVIDLYVMAVDARLEETNGTHVFDPFDDSWIQDTNQYWGYPNAYTGYTNELYLGTTNENAGWIGRTNFPPTWCDEPGKSNPTSRGFRIINGAATFGIIKWDQSANGIKYISAP